MKTTVEINGEQVEVDLDSLTEEELKKYNIRYNKGAQTFTRPKRKALRKIKSIIPLICLMAFFLCGFFTTKGWHWSWTILLLIPVLESVLAFENKSTRRIIASTASLFIIFGIFFCGFYFSVWSWIWVFFFLIPIIHILAE